VGVGVGGVQGQVRDGWRGEVEGGDERRGVADLVLVTGFGAPGQAPDELVRWQVQPDQGGFGLQAAGGGGPSGWVGPFGTKGGDQHRRPACAQVRGGQPGQCLVARLPGQPGQGRVVQVVYAGQAGDDAGERAGGHVKVEDGGAETRRQGGGQRALAGGRRPADQDGGESGQGRASAVAAVGLSGSDGNSRAW
jgi:hypothetical protein